MDKESKAPRRFDDDFKRSSVRLVVDEGYSVRGAARAVGVDPKTIREWIEKFGRQKPSVTKNASKEDLQSEIKRLQKQLSRAEMERDILKKATAYFAKESQ